MAEPESDDGVDKLVEDILGSTQALDIEYPSTQDEADNVARQREYQGYNEIQDLYFDREPIRSREDPTQFINAAGTPAPMIVGHKAPFKAGDMDAIYEANRSPSKLMMWRADEAGCRNGPFYEDASGAPIPGMDIGKSETLIAHYNPTEVEAGVEIEWNRFSSPGSSYAHMHYSGTKNYTTEFELYFSAQTPREVVYITRSRNLLHRWCNPRHENGWSLGLPRLWMYWENSWALQCYIVECKFKHLKFALSGETVRFTAQIKLEEAADQFKFLGDHSVPQRFRQLDTSTVPVGGKAKMKGHGKGLRVGPNVKDVQQLPRQRKQ